MKTYICRFTYKKGNGYALVAANRVSAILEMLLNQKTWDGLHITDVEEVVPSICVANPQIITSGNITTLGSSAYDVAVLLGFKGTPSEWLNSLKGGLGPQGPMGPKGERGLKGEMGLRGPLGEIGPAGILGPQGIQGIPGPIGDKGDTGLSAYQIAVSRGFNGSELEWLESLKADASLQIDAVHNRILNIEKRIHTGTFNAGNITEEGWYDYITSGRPEGSESDESYLLYMSSTGVQICWSKRNSGKCYHRLDKYHPWMPVTRDDYVLEQSNSAALKAYCREQTQGYNLMGDNLVFDNSTTLYEIYSGDLNEIKSFNVYTPLQLLPNSIIKVRCLYRTGFSAEVLGNKKYNSDAYIYVNDSISKNHSIEHLKSDFIKVKSLGSIDYPFSGQYLNLAFIRNEIFNSNTTYGYHYIKCNILTPGLYYLHIAGDFTEGGSWIVIDGIEVYNLVDIDLASLLLDVLRIKDIITEVDQSDTVINKFNEIVAFLENILNTTTLEGILNGINTAIAAKANSADLAEVATSGDYNDLDNKPEIISNSEILTLVYLEELVPELTDADEIADLMDNYLINYNSINDENILRNSSPSYSNANQGYLATTNKRWVNLSDHSYYHNSIVYISSTGKINLIAVKEESLEDMY